ncbi:hypothetical protein [Lapillicoccus jejuensis]|uniref:Uncharacterized protein n=1 Tax=Lapillicoccus jejuensis TaxID=402171 RepID=A0A542E0K1_9MICO|nr:hypothetical protein [Lapillicoccus jejuensis]TQJ08714.1 hypothetical protein FB458_1806 [Lapillicoccus jejuensis]
MTVSIAPRPARAAGGWQPTDAPLVPGWWWVAVAAWGIPEPRPTSSPDPQETPTR